MELMAKVRRALTNSKPIFINLNDGKKRLAYKNLDFVYNKKRVKLTLTLEILDFQASPEPKIGITLWNNPVPRVGWELELEEMPKYIQEFNPQDSFLQAEINRLRVQLIYPDN